MLNVCDLFFMTTFVFMCGSYYICLCVVSIYSLGFIIFVYVLCLYIASVLLYLSIYIASVLLYLSIYSLGFIIFVYI